MEEVKDVNSPMELEGEADDRDDPGESNAQQGEDGDNLEFDKATSMSSEDNKTKTRVQATNPSGVFII